MYNHSRVCYFGLAKAHLGLGNPAGWQTEGLEARLETGQAAPPSAPCSHPVHQDRLQAEHLWQVGIFVLLCPENKNKCLSFLWGSKRTTPISWRGLFWRRESRAKIPSSAGHTLGLSSGSGLHVQPRRNCISIINTVNGWLLSREVHFGPDYMASGPGGSLKSLAADTSLLMCLSSVMPASWRQVWDREGTWPSVLKPASVRALAYMGRPMETSQSDTDETHPGDRGFLQISVSPPLGIDQWF